MKKYFIVMLVISFSTFNSSYGQLTDSFNDANFNAFPTWIGDTNKFIVNINSELQLNSAGSDSSYLSTSIILNSADSLEWNFYIRMPFSPSSQNYCKVFLTSDIADLKQSLNGYYLQFGETGGADAITLWKQTGYNTTQILRGKDSTIANSFEVNIKVLRKTNGEWKLFTDYSSGKNYSLEATGIDPTFTSANFFGFKCNYTSSNATKFYFDSIYVGKEIVDTVKPFIIYCSAIDSNKLQIEFNEAITILSIQDISHYILRPGMNAVVNSQIDSIYPTKAILTFDSTFTSGNKYTLYTLRIEDLNGNINYLDSIKFEYIFLESPKKGDLIITEIMCDPNGAPTLPDAEYIEIYNRSAKYISTNGLKINDASTIGNFPLDTILPYSYTIYCNSSDGTLLQQQNINGVNPLSSFPSLNNEGDIIELFYLNNKLDQVAYNLEWYHHPQKQQGGWSIEKIDVDFLCMNSYNWRASEDLSGGTPGRQNSVIGSFTDNNPPSLLYITVIDSTTIALHVDEPLDLSLLSDGSNYLVDGTSLFGSSISLDESDEKIIVISLPWTIQKGKIYTLSLSEKMQDCVGNFMTNNREGKFGISNTLEPGCLLINEILFNPIGDGKDFIELYNATNNIYNLKDLIIANKDLVTQQTETTFEISKTDRLIFPGDYFAFTESPDNIKSNYRSSNKFNLIKTDLPSLNDDEGIVMLSDKSFLAIDEFHYYENMHFSLLNEKDGISLERISFWNPTNTKENWHSASSACGYATPGNKNSHAIESRVENTELSLDPKIFSPDNDGYQDILKIGMNANKAGYTGSIKIFNETGIMIKSLVSNELMGATSNWVWDGTNDENELLPIGIYIVFAELTNADGDIKKYKIACVLAHNN